MGNGQVRQSQNVQIRERPRGESSRQGWPGKADEEDPPPGQGPLTPALSPQPDHPQWLKCVEETGTFFEPTLEPLFVREVFSPGTRSAVCEGSSPAHVPAPLPPPGSASPRSAGFALLQSMCV